MRPDPETVNFMLSIAELAVEKYAVQHGDLSPYISFREAGRKYGSAIVKKWRDDGLIEFIQDFPNGKIRIDRLKIEAVSKTSNRGL